nr:hypothetical protein [Tanacetum cinerariifolium]
WKSTLGSSLIKEVGAVIKKNCGIGLLSREVTRL